MAGASLFALLDDIATILDDVAVLTKVAAKKTAGVLGDDLALNAQQVAGVSTDREIPVVWAVAKGSVRNKLILVPAALAVSALLPWAVTPLLMLGGLFLCFEGVEKLAHKFLHPVSEAEAAKLREAAFDPAIDLVAFEREKISGAIRTDFILSAEIIVISLGIVALEDFTRRIAVLCAIATIMTVGVYGLVAAIVKVDDLGLYLIRSAGERPEARLRKNAGLAIVSAAPYMMKTLSVLGTAAMFLVGGGILAHGIGPVHHWIEHTAEALSHTSGVGGALSTLFTMATQGGLGIVAGAMVVALVEFARRIRKQPASAAHS